DAELRSFNYAPRPSRSRKGTCADTPARPKLFDWEAIRAKAQEGEIAADNMDPVYLAVASKEAQSPDEAQRALLSAVRRGHQNVLKFRNHVGAASVTMFEVATLAHRLHEQLMKTEPRHRGRG